jgi:glycosyltransferase involved in cell wall biosynthesis
MIVAPPKKTLHVIDSLDLGGAQTFLLELVKNLDRSNYLSEVVCLHGRGVYLAAFEKEGVKVRSLSRGKWPPMYLPNFWQLMRQKKYDILHFHLFGANLCAKPLAIMAGHPAIVVHDQCNDASREKNPILLAADAFWNRRSSRIIAVSHSVRNYIINREDLPDAMVEVIPNGIDPEAFTPASAQEKEAARIALGFSMNAFVIGGVGRLVPQKNFMVFIEIASRILLMNPEVLFVIAGTGEQESHLKTAVGALGISEHVLFLGHVADRIGLYHALDAVIMPSDFEGTPMSLLEAMSSGVPVVAHAVDGIAEVCTDGVDALLSPRGDSDGLVKAVKYLLADNEIRQKLSANARKTILDHYDIKKLVHKIEAVYEDVLNE